jgi:DNA-binding NarL/FixJ family response regulator
MIRERLAEVIQREPDLAVCGEAEDHQHALEAVEKTRPNLVIVDLTLKNSHGLDLIKDLQVRRPDLAILVVSMHDESLHAERVIHAGAMGYITKQEATKRILIAIRTVLKGEIYMSEKSALRLASRMTSRPGSRPQPPIEKLTDRELRVLELLGKGLGTRQIADRLNISIRTVETYRARIKDKLQLKDGNELLQYAFRWSL